jgi:putative DNA primase/helicase
MSSIESGSDDTTTEHPPWAQVLASADRPTFGEVTGELADRLNLSDAEAGDRLADALDRGELVERETGGLFPELDVPGADGDTEAEDPEPQAQAAEADRELDTASIREHYRRSREAIEAGGALGELRALGNKDFLGWYQTRPDGEGGSEGRVYHLSDDFDTLASDVERTLYASINYQAPETARWDPYTWGESGREWGAGTEPTPEYDDLGATALLGEIDLKDEHKERPLPAEKQAAVERAIPAFIEEFATLAGGREHVFALDSVGGFYLLVAPGATRPIGRAFDGETRAEVFGELADRMNEWLLDAGERVFNRVPEAEEYLKVDRVNHKNRLYKTPLSAHSSIPGVVRPIDTDAPSYDLAEFPASEELIEDVGEWGRAFTDESHAQAVGAVVDTLWSDVESEPVDRDGGGWLGRLRRWDVERRAKERARMRRKNRTEADRGPRGASFTEHFGDVAAAIEEIDVTDVARETADAWATAGGRDPPRFNPGYRDSEGGQSCFATSDKFVDLKEESGGGAIHLIALDLGLMDSPGDDLRGSDFMTAARELRSRGYDVPILVTPTGGEDGDGPDKTPLAQLRRVAVAEGVLPESAFVPKPGEFGEYRDFPGESTRRTTLRLLADAGIEHGW